MEAVSRPVWWMFWNSNPARTLYPGAYVAESQSDEGTERGIVPCETSNVPPNKTDNRESHPFRHFVKLLI